jgi:extradiol dioxygenase family protein
MNRLTILIALLLTPFLHAQDLEVSKPVLFAKAPVKVKQYDLTNKKWIEVDGYGYSFMFHLKNISDKQLTVATDGLSQQTSSGEPKQNVIFDMNKMTAANGGGLVIPSRNDFRLVDIRPGEVAMMKTEFKMAVPLEEITITYNPKDFYDGRFGYWTGKVVSDTAILDAQK